VSGPPKDIDLAPGQSALGSRDVIDLGHPDVLVEILEGEVAVFAAEVVAARPEGERRFLFCARAGSLLAGVRGEPGASVGLIAVPTPSATISRRSLAAFLSDMGGTADGNAGCDRAEALDRLIDWVCKVEAAFPSLPAPPGRSPDDEGYGVLEADEGFEVWQGDVLLVAAASGRARVLGLGAGELRPGQGAPFPLARGFWVKAVEPAELSAVSIRTVESADLAAALGRLQEFLLEAVKAAWHRERVDQAARFAEKQRRSREMTDGSIGSLAALLSSAPTPESDGAPPILAAARIVGDYLGIKVNAPAASEDPDRVADVIQAIARASGIRYREVTLEGKWYRRDAGPLLAYVASDERPVAILPRLGGHYEVVDPRTGTRQMLSPDRAAELFPKAYQFFRPLPNRPFDLLDLGKLALGKSAPELILFATITFVASLFGIMAPWVTGILIDQAIPDSNRALMVTLCLALLFAAVGQLIFEFCESMLQLRLETRADMATQSAVWDYVLKLPARFFRQFSVGDLNSRISGISEIRRSLSGATIAGVFTGLFSVQFLVVMLAISPRLAAVAFFIAIVSGTLTLLSAVAQYRAPILEDISGPLVQLLTGITKFRVAAIEDRAFAYWSRLYSRIQLIELRIIRLGDRIEILMDLLPTISIIALIYFASKWGLLTIAGGTDMSTGEFLTFNAAYGAFIGALTGLVEALVSILPILREWRRVKPVIEAIPEVRDDQEDPGRLKGKVVLDQVSFRYDPDGPLILDGVTVFAEPGESIAIVGPSGCGKSTLFRLLLAFEEPEAGSVYFDGKNLANLDRRAVRRQLGVVLQNGKVSAGSILANITCGALVSRDEAKHAAKLAGFDKDLAGMPMGLDTVVSEGGTNLSGGQRQRLLVCRAFVLKPRIMLFDEATSALDNTTQAVVSESMDRLNVTRLIIAHRLSTIRQCDRIYVLDKGKVVQQGTFAELEAQGGLFGRLVAHQ